MTIWTGVLLIALICVMVIDISGFIPSMEGVLAKWLKVKAVRIPKPFSCSLCSTFWASMIYALCVGQLTLPVVAYSLFVAIMTPIISDLIWNVRDFVGLMIIALFNFFRNGRENI